MDLTFSGFKDPHMNINAFFINRTCSEQYSDGIVMWENIFSLSSNEANVYYFCCVLDSQCWISKQFRFTWQWMSPIEEICTLHIEKPAEEASSELFNVIWLWLSVHPWHNIRPWIAFHTVSKSETKHPFKIKAMLWHKNCCTMTKFKIDDMQNSIFNT